LGHAIAAALPYTQRAVLDGEIVCLDRKGRPQFEDLLFRRGVPCFFAFDLLYDGKDRRRDALVDRKLELRRMIGRFSLASPTAAAAKSIAAKDFNKFQPARKEVLAMLITLDLSERG
jgi:ATP-dependent DNA ligase